MQQNFNEILPLLPDSSRVWVYAASRPLTKDDKAIAENLLNRFISQWATHGSAMTAGACVLFDRFLVIAADEQKMAASGCSIDSSVRVIKEIGQTISVDFFDRLNVHRNIRKYSIHLVSRAQTECWQSALQCTCK